MKRKDFMRKALFGVVAAVIPSALIAKMVATPKPKLNWEPLPLLPSISVVKQYHLHNIIELKLAAIKRGDFDAAMEYRRQEKELLGITKETEPAWSISDLKKVTEHYNRFIKMDQFRKNKNKIV